MVSNTVSSEFLFNSGGLVTGIVVSVAILFRVKLLSERVSVELGQLTAPVAHPHSPFLQLELAAVS